MMGKLLKYEFQATARIYLPLYLVMVIFAFLGRLSLWKLPWHMTQGADLTGTLYFRVGPVAGEGLLGQILGFLATMTLLIYVLVVLGSLVVHCIISIQRFWKNLMGNEGYLMFTLPVTTGQLLWSKAICAFVWGIATALMVVVAAVILAWHPWFLELLKSQWAGFGPDSQALMLQMAQNIIPPVLRPLLVAEFVINGFGSLFLLYASMAMGHTVKRHKVLASLGAYTAITTVVGTIASLLLSAVFPWLAAGMEDIQLFMSTPDLLAFSRQMGGYLTATWCVVMVIDLATTVGCFLLARYLLKTQLNLE